MRNIEVQFKENGKKYIFSDNDLDVKVNDYVIVQTERGLQFGKIVSLLEDNNGDHSIVEKIATKEDKKQNDKNIRDAAEALIKADELAKDYSLDMKFIDVYYTFDRKQLVFQFLADNRVDFRELAKSLASIYKTRIELRQVGVRDKAKEISGIGQCGRKLCCSSFLKDMDSIGISQVKNQNLSLNPNKINGQCGRLLCCLKYEDELYNEYRKDLPEVGDKIKYNNELATVISVNIPLRKYVLITDSEEKVEVEVPIKREKNEKRSNK